MPLRPSQVMYPDTSKEDVHERAKTRLAANVKRLRTDQKLSQEDLGLRVDADQAYISRIEAARLNPTIESIAEIAHALDVPVAKLLT